MFLDGDQRPQKGMWAPGNYWCTCHKCKKQFTGDKRAITCAECAYSEAGPEAATDVEIDIVARLREACNGHPNAEIPWPHRLLHDAIAEIETLRSQNNK
ncbi:hypothetical protein [Roseibium alexandrii]|uniref:hypothetical protein n=1 Tax=Roseibium alexandrii TaxID=388408 RepID=UPI003752CD16